MATFIAPVGPLFGPDFVVVTVNDDTGRQYDIEVYPDAMNQELRAAGLSTQYYFQPAHVYLAKKETAPEDFDFGMVVFKGLMTAEDTIGIPEGGTTGGDVEAGGGFLTLSTTFAIPENVIAKVKQKLKAHDHNPPIPRLMNFFNYQDNDPEPELGIVPITKSSVSIEVPELSKVGPDKMPFFISAQGTGKGSIEAHGFNSFLVTCNQLAAGAIAGGLKNGQVGITVHNLLTEQFYINGVTVEVDVDVDKVFDSFSAAVSAGGFLGIDSINASYAYSSCVTNGGITTKMTMNGAVLEQPIKDWITKNVDEMRKTAIDLVKSEIFDWKPTEDAPASTDRGWFSSIFGGSSVSVKAKHEKRAVHFNQTLILNESIAVEQMVSGDLTDLQPAVRAHLDRYLVVLDIAEFFKKVQVIGTSSVNFGEKLPDGTDLRDPIQSVQMQVSYPDFTNPLLGDGKVNLVTHAEGFHYTIGQKDLSAAASLATWSKDDPFDIVNVPFLRLDQNVPEWPKNQVKVRKTLVYDPSDPRVDLKNGGDQLVIERISEDHAPILDPAEVGYVFIHFILGKQLPPNISATLTATIGQRTDTIEINSANQKNILWEIFSDKFFQEDHFTYRLEITATGPNFTDDDVVWSTDADITVPLPVGRLKYLNPFKLSIPNEPPEMTAVIEDYIKRSKPAPAAPPAPAPVLQPAGGGGGGEPVP